MQQPAVGGSDERRLLCWCGVQEHFQYVPDTLDDSFKQVCYESSSAPGQKVPAIATLASKLSHITSAAATHRIIHCSGIRACSCFSLSLPSRSSDVA